MCLTQCNTRALWCIYPLHTLYLRCIDAGPAPGSNVEMIWELQQYNIIHLTTFTRQVVCVNRKCSWYSQWVWLWCQQEDTFCDTHGPRWTIPNTSTCNWVVVDFNSLIMLTICFCLDAKMSGSGNFSGHNRQQTGKWIPYACLRGS